MQVQKTRLFENPKLVHEFGVRYEVVGFRALGRQVQELLLLQHADLGV